MENSFLTSDMDSDVLSIAEAAKLLKVSTVTLHRWLKQGRLRAYRLGPRAVRIRRSDLDELLLPLSPEAGQNMFEAEKICTNPEEIPRLTEDEKKRQLEAIESARAFREEVAARRGGKPFSPSWPLIREAREERSEQLLRSDLSKVLTAASGEARTAGEHTGAHARPAFRPLTEEEADRRLAAINEVQSIREEILAERRGKPFAPSWPLIRKAREERSKRI